MHNKILVLSQKDTPFVAEEIPSRWEAVMPCYTWRQMFAEPADRSL